MKLRRGTVLFLILVILPLSYAKKKSKKSSKKRQEIDLHKLSEKYEEEDPDEEAIWETKSEKKRRERRERRERAEGSGLPEDGERMDPLELQDLLASAKTGGRGGAMMGGGGATIKSMSAILKEGTCDGSLPPSRPEEPMAGKECAEKLMNRYSAIVATGGIPSVMHLAQDNSTILYVYNGLEQILQMTQMRDFLLTQEEVKYVQQDNTRHWPNGAKEEIATSQLKEEAKERRGGKPAVTRKMKKAEVARLKAEEAAARERHQAMEKARTAEKLEADQAKEAEARLADGDFADEVEREALARTVTRAAEQRAAQQTEHIDEEESQKSAAGGEDPTEGKSEAEAKELGADGGSEL